MTVPAANPQTKREGRRKGGMSDRMTARRNRELRRPLHRTASGVRQVQPSAARFRLHPHLIAIVFSKAGKTILDPSMPSPIPCRAASAQLLGFSTPSTGKACGASPLTPLLR